MELRIELASETYANGVKVLDDVWLVFLRGMSGLLEVCQIISDYAYKVPLTRTHAR